MKQRDALDRREPGSPRANRFERHAASMLFVYLVLLLSASELIARVLVSQGLLAHRHYETTRQPTFLGDIDPNFGVWHYPNATGRHSSECFDVTYHSNSYGARDEERTKASDASRRVVVLGDSFVEGYGEEAADRMTNLLEARTGVEHLNFGTSGNFGSIQEAVLYDTLAAEFDHTEVYVFLLPDNDFKDNDPASSDGRYRPYYRKTDGGYELYYPVAFADRPVIRRRSFKKIVRNHVYNHVYLLNAMARISFEEPRPPLDRGSTYADIAAEDMERLLFSYDRIIERAGNRPVTIFVVPRWHDLHAYVERGEAGELVTDLLQWASGRPSVRVVDLREPMLEGARKRGAKPADLFHSCDGHWSSLGNLIAAESVLQATTNDAPN